MWRKSILQSYEFCLSFPFVFFLYHILSFPPPLLFSLLFMHSGERSIIFYFSLYFCFYLLIFFSYSSISIMYFYFIFMFFFSIHLFPFRIFPLSLNFYISLLISLIIDFLSVISFLYTFIFIHLYIYLCIFFPNISVTSIISLILIY